MMNALLALLFVLGIGIGLVLAACSPPKPKARQQSRRGSKLDAVDQMVFWGEVNDDDFYRM